MLADASPVAAHSDGSLSSSLLWTLRVLTATRSELYRWSDVRCFVCVCTFSLVVACRDADYVALLLAREASDGDATAALTDSRLSNANEYLTRSTLVRLLQTRLNDVVVGDAKAATSLVSAFGCERGATAAATLSVRDV